MISRPLSFRDWGGGEGEERRAGRRGRGEEDGEERERRGGWGREEDFL